MSMTTKTLDQRKALAVVARNFHSKRKSMPKSWDALSKEFVEAVPSVTAGAVHATLEALMIVDSWWHADNVTPYDNADFRKALNRAKVESRAKTEAEVKVGGIPIVKASSQITKVAAAKKTKTKTKTSK